jgi:NAD(P)-dependent dehydrogenase (short-subunit alcohol dehydrogenase family)
MKDFNGKLAVITGAGAGMGRQLARQLATQGCHLALCDVSQANLDETKRQCGADNQGVTVSTHICDVADKAQVLAFADAVKSAHDTQSINLLFNNAGIGAGASFIKDSEEDWERCFNICWYGVYYCSRGFMPLLMASDEGHLINTASVAGFWATAGGVPVTAYSAAKFAVKGFSESLIDDLRINAPHIKVSVVMPGYIGTDIFTNSGQIAHGDLNTPEAIANYRRHWRNLGVPVDDMNDEQLHQWVQAAGKSFTGQAPTTATDAAGIILDGVRNQRWRILVGKDAETLDSLVREAPEVAYDPEFKLKARELGAWVDWAI